MSRTFNIFLPHVWFWEVAPAFSDKRNVSLLLALQSQIQCRKRSCPPAILVHQQQHCHLICKHRTIMMGKNRRGSLAFRFHFLHEELSVGKNIFFSKQVWSESNLERSHMYIYFSSNNSNNIYQANNQQFFFFLSLEKSISSIILTS